MEDPNPSSIKIELISFLYVHGAKTLREIATALDLAEDKVFNVAIKYPELFKLHPMPSGKTIFIQLKLENTIIGNLTKQELEKLKQAKKNHNNKQ